MRSVKTLLQVLLARTPKLYRTLLRAQGKGKYSLDKVVFLSVIRLGDVIFDIGANRGHYTVTFAHVAGPNGKVYAFEPVPPTFDKLIESITTSAYYQNVIPNCFAVTQSTGSEKIYLPGNDDGQSSLRVHQSGSWSGEVAVTTFDVSTVSMDEYVQQNNLVALDFVKIDTEGSELPALRGGLQTLTKFHPLLYVEICNEWTADFHYAITDLVTLTMELGYNKFFLVADKITELEQPLVALDSSRFSGSANLLCGVAHLHKARLDSLPKC